MFFIKKIHIAGRIPSIGEMADVVNQLPDLIFFQFLERFHPGAVRAVFDDPEQLPVGQFFHGLITGEVPGIRLHPRENDSKSVAPESMAGVAGDRLDTLVKQLFSRSNVLFTGKQDIFHSCIRFRGGRRAAGLRTQAGLVYGLHFNDFRLRYRVGDFFSPFTTGPQDQKAQSFNTICNLRNCPYRTDAAVVA